MIKKILHSKQFQLTAAIFCLLAISLLLRINAFWMPHWKGDQSHYVTLAMKLEERGLDGYSLREARLGHRVVQSEQGPIEFIVAAPAPRGVPGDLIAVLKGIGQGYYDEPLHMRAPLFAYTLMVSHKIFSPKDLYQVYGSQKPSAVLKSKPWIVFKTHFWAAVVPVFFNLGVIALTFLTARKFFGNRTALWSAVVLSANPVSLFVCHRLFTEDLALCFLMLSMFLFLKFFPKNNYPGLFLAGVCGGLAVLTRQTAGVIVFILGAYVIVCRGRAAWNLRGWLQSAFHPVLWVYLLGVLSVSGFWFLKVIEVYGEPLHVPAEGMRRAVREDITGWFRALSLRPHPIIFFSLGTVVLCPIFAAVFLTLKEFTESARNIWRSAPNRDFKKDVLVFLWLWVIGFYLWASQPWHFLRVQYSQESRYFYPAYPALAILAVWALEKIFSKKINSEKNAVFRELWMALPVLLHSALCVLWAFWFLNDNQVML